MCSEQKESRINIDKVREAIEQVANDFRNDERIILTEHDMQWHICYYLQQNKDMRKYCLSDECYWDPDDEYSIHTEANWALLVQDDYNKFKQGDIKLFESEP
ncbi:MAG: hypothetical protein K2N69_01300, partial [Helicobacter sp.]|nr:hypothetical protein [Helicobacter sp.]